MMTPLFIWLGSGRASRRKVDSPGQWLDRAAQAGLPVPPGAILLDEFYRLAVGEGLVVAEEGGRLIVPDAELLHNTLLHSVRLPRFDHPVNIRPVTCRSQLSATATNLQPVNFSMANEVAEALTGAWSVRSQSDEVARLDVLIIETVASLVYGSAISGESGAEDEVVYRLTDPSVSNETNGDGRLILPRIDRYRRSQVDTPPFAHRLQLLLRGLRRTIGEDRRIVHWADDGRICFVLRIDPPVMTGVPSPDVLKG